MSSTFDELDHCRRHGRMAAWPMAAWPMAAWPMADGRMIGRAGLVGMDPEEMSRIS